MVSRSKPDAKECIDQIRAHTSEPEFGYKVQALAAHVLLELGHKVKEVRQSGHPDISSFKDGIEHRFEIEAQVGAPRPRKPSEADFAVLLGEQQVAGYYALAIHSPVPEWVVVPAEELLDRRFSSPNALLRTLRDPELSEQWSHAYQKILKKSCRRILLGSFASLRERALNGRML